MSDAVSVQCCIAGGGPAGMMLGLLLARAGVEVLVLEKHADFLRDFRGDTIHPSTLEVMHELGFLNALLQLPHQKAARINAQFGGLALTVADFTYLKARCPYILFMPQWDFLDFLADRAIGCPTFRLQLNAQVTGLITEGGAVTGIQAETSQGSLRVHAPLVIGADGRHSIVREYAGLRGLEFGAPMDVLWFRLSRKSLDPTDPLGRFDSGSIFIMLNRDTYWQCGFVIPKGAHEQIREWGLPALCESIMKSAPFIADRVSELQDWEDVKLLTVQIGRLVRWYKPGLLCIGDAAHAMSPVGGVGINLAIQDAVAASNLLAVPLREGRLTVADLHRVQQRRVWPTVMTQRLQLFLQHRVISRVLNTAQPLSPPLVLRLLARFPFLRAIPARLMGTGFRPEHVKTQSVWPNETAND